MSVQNYVNKIAKVYAKGDATEHSYRRDLQNLANELISSIEITNEPKRIKCGAPDYVITKKEIPIGYIEAKDIGKPLDEIEKSEQLKRYRASLPNLILTDYLEFRFFRDGEKVNTIQIASIENGKIKPTSENFKLFELNFTNFCSFKGQTIKSPEKLAKMMAQKARLMEEVLFKVINEDDEDNTLRDQLDAFRQILIHDLDEKTFSDIYAQTIAYGLFAARLHDTTVDDFSRQEARILIPKSNPFLRNLFDYVMGPELDDRVVWIVDDLADIFRAADLPSILADFGSSTGQTDPFIHFYETFLGEYNPKLRKSRGVYYTPGPVVNFIVRAVDDILKEEFNLPRGLADTSKTKVKYEILKRDRRSKSGYTTIEKQEDLHKVQILDPATGTGTFLAEVIKQIYLKFEGQKGLWSKYVEEHLLPRINGFEILMAPYTMCHLKIEMLLKDTGYVPKEKAHSKRLKVFLTNSLEEIHPESGTLFASWLSREATAANHVKENAPVMVVIGNPPYSVSSSNKSKWIQDLIADYKTGLNERKLNIDDDYIKFIRYGQHFIDKNGEGVLAYISNNSFISGVTHRQMRTHLLQSFDEIYILDLHGNSKKKETCPDGSPDMNVFDIMQGVSINIFIKVKNNTKSNLAKVFHFDLYGGRNYKYQFLQKQAFSSVPWSEIKYQKPFNFFIPINYDAIKKYDAGFQLSNLFINYNSGIQTKNDNLTIKHTSDELNNVIHAFKNLDKEELIKQLSIKDSAGWKIQKAKDDIIENEGSIIDIQYRLFDYRKTYFTGKSSGFIGRTRGAVMKSMLQENIALIFKRTGKIYGDFYDFCFISDTVISEGLFAIDPLGREYLAPLYNYPEGSNQQSFDGGIRTHNLNITIIEKIEKSLSLTFTPEKENRSDAFSPIDVMDYTYAILYSPIYREKFKEFLKIDFPKVPYPQDAKIFWKLAKLGGEIRQIHLLESPKVEKFITSYPIDGSNIVEKPKYEDGKVWINNDQYFDKVPEIAWNFYIGGYQPAQKWLKDRKGRELLFEDIMHYQKIIVALTETDRIMKKIDKVIEI